MAQDTFSARASDAGLDSPPSHKGSIPKIECPSSGKLHTRINMDSRGGTSPVSRTISAGSQDPVLLSTSPRTSIRRDLDLGNPYNNMMRSSVPSRLRSSRDETDTESMADSKAGDAKWWNQAWRNDEISFDEDRENTVYGCQWICLTLRTLMHMSIEYKKALSWHLVILLLTCGLSLIAGGVILVYVWSLRFEQSQRSDAENKAVQIATFIESQLNQVLVPLYTLRAFAVRLPNFQELSKIAQEFPVDEVKSATHRDVAGRVPKSVADEFEEISLDITSSLDDAVSASVLNLQLAPRGVICLISPLKGNEGALGLDLLRAPKDLEDVRKTVVEGMFTMAGPITLVQGGFALIGRLPVFVDQDFKGAIDVRAIEGICKKPEESQRYFWGFTTVIFSFEKLMQDSGIEKRLREERLYFNLTRMAPKTSNNVTTWKNVSLLSSDVEMLKQPVTVPVNVPNGEWFLHVTAMDGFSAPWFTGAIVVVVLCSLLVTFMLMLMLISHKIHRRLLYNIMPKRVVSRLEQGRPVVDVFNDVTIFFSDLVGFTDLSTRNTPLEVMRMLNELYTQFDELAEKHNVFKVDTIGDAYMVVGGTSPKEFGPEGAARVAHFALEALESAACYGHGLQMRAGMASGCVVAGVLGRTVPKYSFFGDAVNTASRMESTGKPGRLQVTEGTWRLLKESNSKDTLNVVPRSQEITVKGKGRMRTFWVTNRQAVIDTCLPVSVSNVSSPSPVQGGEEQPDQPCSERNNP